MRNRALGARLEGLRCEAACNAASPRLFGQRPGAWRVVFPGARALLSLALAL